MKPSLVTVLVLLAALAAPSSGVMGQDVPVPGQVEAAVVRVGGCTGVCVHPRGLVLSVKHCGHGAEETVVFAVGEFTARRVYESTGAEGPVVFDCGSSGLPWAAVATRVPPAGSSVWTSLCSKSHVFVVRSPLGASTASWLPAASNVYVVRPLPSWLYRTRLASSYVNVVRPSVLWSCVSRLWSGLPRGRASP